VLANKATERDINGSPAKISGGNKRRFLTQAGLVSEILRTSREKRIFCLPLRRLSFGLDRFRRKRREKRRF
jgi:hypothetical protein